MNHFHWYLIWMTQEIIFIFGFFLLDLIIKKTQHKIPSSIPLYLHSWEGRKTENKILYYASMKPGQAFVVQFNCLALCVVYSFPSHRCKWNQLRSILHHLSTSVTVLYLCEISLRWMWTNIKKTFSQWLSSHIVNRQQHYEDQCQRPRKGRLKLQFSAYLNFIKSYNAITY